MESAASRKTLLGIVMGGFVLALGVIVYVFAPFSGPEQAVVENAGKGMSQIPVALWWLGSVILGGALIYGILSNRYRTPREKQATEAAVKRNLADET